jgi:hypothetical protein
MAKRRVSSDEDDDAAANDSNLSDAMGDVQPRGPRNARARAQVKYSFSDSVCCPFNGCGCDACVRYWRFGYCTWQCLFGSEFCVHLQDEESAEESDYAPSD